MRLALAGMALAALAACDPETAAREAEHHGARPLTDAAMGTGLVLSVDGVPITVEDVVGVARITGLEPRAAAVRMEEQELLAAEAARRGYGTRREVQLLADQAAVQALLRAEVDAVVTENSVDAAAVAAEYLRQRRRFVQPERRASRHILARLAEAADPATEALARGIAERAVSELRFAADVSLVFGSYSEAPSRDGVTVTVEDVPPLDRGAAAAEEYKAAIFALGSPGLVPLPVRTSFGWHAIVLTSIQQARDVSAEDAAPVLRREIALSRRRARLGALLDEIGARSEVVRNERAIAAALANDQ